MIHAHVPEFFSYQSIVRNAGGQPLVSQTVSLWFTIYKTNPSGTDVYSEKHTPVTNEFGLVTLAIGDGDDKSGDFASIDWGANSYFLNVQIDPAGGDTYTDMGTTQLLSVPYAIYANTAKNFTETDPKVGTNTTNYLSEWDGTALVSSTVFDKEKVGTGTESPGGYLEVTDKGDLNPTNLIILGQTITTKKLRLSSGTNYAIISAGLIYDETKGLVIRHLTGYLGGESVAGGELKETGTIHRTSSNTDANNVTGFTGLPGGLRCYDNTFMSIGTQGWWWTTTQDTGPYNPYYRDMNNSTGNCYSGSTRSDHELSICCVKD